MPISVSALAKQLEIAPEAIVLHAMDLDFEIPEDDMVPDDIAVKIRKLEIGDEIAQVEHKLEEQLDREIVEEQQKKTAAQKKVSHKKKKEKKEDESQEKITISEDGSIILPNYISVREFATKISKPIPIILIKLKQNGVIANLKQEIDYETAAIIAADLDVKVKREAAELSSEDLFRGDLSVLLSDEEPENLVSRPPIISVMGHVDHGKTSILDYIRKTKVVEGEAGGITQGIGAYQVEIKDQKISFLDTPGHEAFTAMRARGARLTDIAILVVSATEGLKPQSIEAINHAKDAEIPIVVAINKMDLEGANPDLVKSQLAEHGLTPEDWQGDTPCIEVSAKTGAGIDKLLETILIVAELENLKANPNRRAIGTVVEASMDMKSGVSATVLVNTGTLKKGDVFTIYDQSGKIRRMLNFNGEEIESAPPSTPVLISGLSKPPKSGDILQIMVNEKTARKKAEEVASILHVDELTKRKKLSLAHLKTKLAEEKMGQLKIIAKAESEGTLEAVKSELVKIKNDSSFVKVIHSGVGEITESDIMLASSGGAIVVGFAVKIPSRIADMARQEGVKIIQENVIYHLTEKVEEILSNKAQEEQVEEILGELLVKGVFASNKKMAVIGGLVEKGKIRKLSHIRQFRKVRNEETNEEEEALLGEAKVNTVQQGVEEKNEIGEGAECGLKISHNGLVFEIGDRIEFFVKKK